MAISAGKLDRRLQIRRYATIDDGLQMVEAWADHGAPIWASRKDVSDGERAVAGWLEATSVARFIVRSSSFTRGLTPKDRLKTEDRDYDIQGIKELGRRDWLEITAIAQVDQ